MNRVPFLLLTYGASSCIVLLHCLLHNENRKKNLYRTDCIGVFHSMQTIVLTAISNISLAAWFHSESICFRLLGWKCCRSTASVDPESTSLRINEHWFTLVKRLYRLLGIRFLSSRIEKLESQRLLLNLTSDSPIYTNVTLMYVHLGD